MVKFLFYSFLYTILLLLDVAPLLQHLTDRLAPVVQWMDAVLLRGNHYVGREGTEMGDDRASCAPSNPGPRSLRGVSQATQTHLNALAFCNRVLAQEEQRVQEEKQLKKREKLSKSQRLLETTPDTGAREEVEFQFGDDLALVMKSSNNKRISRSRSADCLSPLNSDPEEEDEAQDLAWIDVGAKIGMRLLHSEHVQRAMVSQETTDLLFESMQQQRSLPLQKQQQPVSKPVHPMWASPTIGDDPSESVTQTNHNEDGTLLLQSSPQRRMKQPGRCCRPALEQGVKVAVPITSYQPGRPYPTRRHQIATVASSQRIFVDCGEGTEDSDDFNTNCLSVTVKLEKSFLRNGAFADLTFRVMDAWTSSRAMPRHSKVPIGSCVATAYGIGVLVGWRSSDECHIVRSLWRSSHAYLHKDAIYSTIEAATGFHVKTKDHGWGIIQACSSTEQQYTRCRFHVMITDVGEYMGKTIEIPREDIVSCPGAQFMPVIEHVRAAALYQIQVDQYNAVVRGRKSKGDQTSEEEQMLHTGSVCAEIIWNSFLKAVGEDEEFDNGVNAFFTSLREFLHRLDKKNSEEEVEGQEEESSDAEELSCIERTKTFESGTENEVEVQLTQEGNSHDSPDGFWIMNDLFGGFFQGTPNESSPSKVLSDSQHSSSSSQRPRVSGYDRAFAVLKTIMKTVSIARAASVEHPHFRMALAIFYDFLLFVRTIVKIQQRNDSASSLSIWKRAGLEIRSTFGPIKDRIESIGRGIALRMEHQGRIAKARALRLFDRIMTDEALISALEHGEWERGLARLEIALVETEIIDASKLSHYRKAAKFLHGQFRMLVGGDASAATRNSEKLRVLGVIVQACAAPRRSILRFFMRNDMLELFERILVRAYHKEEVATRMLTIHAANFHSLRHLRMLKDFSVAGRIWIPLLDAADEEFSWLVSKMPEKSKSILCPLSSLFSLCVAQFHRINAGDLSRDWLAFLLEEDSVKIVHDINMRLILALESFSQDIKEMMMVLPYYPR